MGTGRLVLMGVWACALAACSSESADAGAFGVAADAGDEGSGRPVAPAKSVDAGVSDAELGDAGAQSDVVAIEPCPIGVTRCFEYAQQRCIEPSAGWTDLGTTVCCVDEQRFVYSAATQGITDTKTTLQWRRERDGGCESPWRGARIAEAKTLMFPVGKCSPNTDKRYFGDPILCDSYGTDCVDMTTGATVPNGSGDRLCIR